MNNEIVPSFAETIFNSDVKNLVISYGELGLDDIIQDEILAKIPMIKTIVSFGEAGLRIHERNLLIQTFEFAKGMNTGTITEERKKKYQSKLKDTKFAEKELGRIIIILNQQIENYQSEVLGRLFLSRINETITWDEFCEFAEANRRMFVSDYLVLDKLSKRNIELQKEDKYKVGRLIGLGMVVERNSPAMNKTLIEQFENQEVKKKRSNILPEPDYMLTSFGEKFLLNIQKGRE